MTMTSRKIGIYRDNVWAGDGTLRDGTIEDCSAVLAGPDMRHEDGSEQESSDATYEAIEEAIEDGQAAIERDGYTYTWSVS